MTPAPCADCGLAPGPLGKGPLSKLEYWTCKNRDCPSHYQFSEGRTLEEATRNWNAEQARRAAELAAAEGEAR